MLNAVIGERAGIRHCEVFALVATGRCRNEGTARGGSAHVGGHGAADEVMLGEVVATEVHDRSGLHLEAFRHIAEVAVSEGD